jgi:hypothetical protein
MLCVWLAFRGKKEFSGFSFQTFYGDIIFIVVISQYKRYVIKYIKSARDIFLTC